MEWYIFAFGSALAFGINSVLIKKILRHEHILEYLFLYIISIFILLLPLRDRVNFNLEPSTYFLIYLDAVVLTVSLVCSVLALKHLAVSRISPLYNLTIVFTAFAGFFLFKEALTAKNLAGIFLMVFGTYTLSSGLKMESLKAIKNHWKAKNLKFVFIAIIASALSFVIDKIVLTPESAGLSIISPDAFTLQFLTRGFLMLNFFVIVAFFKNKVGIWHGIRNVGWMILLVSVIFNVANIMYYVAVKKGFISLVIPIIFLNTLFATIIGGELFHEHNLKRKFFACIIMVLATYLIVG